MNKHQKRFFAVGVVAAVLAAAFWYGGDAPGLQGWQTASQSASSASTSSVSLPPDVAAGPASALPDVSAPVKSEQAPEQSTQTTAPNQSSLPAAPAAASADQSGATSSSQVDASAKPPEEGVSPAPSEAPVLTCTLSIRCDSVLDHLDWLNPDKTELIPADGTLLAAAQVSVQAGETVFDLLQRQTRAAGIQMEATFTPGYGSSYVEGIANLYEFDCGQQSGWTYLVNGVQPGYGSSQYSLSDGDVVEWVYSCNLGKDVGTGETG
ncbi:MAG: DUF4430 domain-containing protein [Lawsonibacter sp.]|nr:DUF4430 domain-containing protein [Lawsonibacter sp.]